MTYTPPPPQVTPPGPPWPTAAVELPRHPLTVAGFVIGVVGAVLAIIPIVGVVSWVVSPVGFVLSLVAVCSTGRPGRVMATWGVGLSGLGILLCCGWLLLLADTAGGTNSASTGNASNFGSASSSTGPNGPIESGTYMVGLEITPGMWHTSGGSHCYYERDRNTDDTIDSIISNDNFTGPTTIAIRSSDAAVKFSGDCTWSMK